MFNSKGVKAQKGFKTGKFINIGPQELKITNLTHSASKAGDKFKITVHWETKPVQEDGFEGQDGALGQIGKADLGIYTNGSDQQWNDILSMLVTIAELFGVREQMDGVSAGSIEEYLNQLKKLFANKYAWWLVGGEEYQGTDADGNPKVKYTLKIPRYTFIAESESALKDKMKNKEFPIKGNPDTQWYYKQLEVMDQDIPETQSDESNQLPF